jgi:Transposase DDE domain group 1
LDKKLEITSRFAQCFQDHRSSSYVHYPLHRLLAQRIYAIALGYEDVNDHDKLRNDPALAIALDRISHINPNQELSRLFPQNSRRAICKSSLAII